MRKRKLHLNGPPLVRTYQGEEKEARTSDACGYRVGRLQSPVQDPLRLG